MSRVESQQLRGTGASRSSDDSSDGDSYDEPWDVPRPHSQDSSEGDGAIIKENINQNNTKMRGTADNEIGDLPALSLSRSEEELSNINRRKNSVLTGQRTMRPLSPPSLAGMPGNIQKQDRDDIEEEDEEEEEEEEEEYDFGEDDMPMDERMDYQRKCGSALCIDDSVDADGSNLCAYTFNKMGEICGNSPGDDSPQRSKWTKESSDRKKIEEKNAVSGKTSKHEIKPRQDIPAGVDEQTAIEVEYVEPDHRPRQHVEKDLSPQRRGLDPNEMRALPNGTSDPPGEKRPQKKSILGKAFSRKPKQIHKLVDAAKDSYRERLEASKSSRLFSRKRKDQDVDVDPTRDVNEEKAYKIEAYDDEAYEVHEEEDRAYEDEAHEVEPHEIKSQEDRAYERRALEPSPQENTAHESRAYKSQAPENKTREDGAYEEKAEKTKSPRIVLRKLKDPYEEAERIRDQYKERDETARSPARRTSENNHLEPPKSPKRKSALLNAMTKRAKEDYEKGKTPPSSSEPAAEESGASSDNAYSSLSQSEKRKFLKLINSGLTPSEATKKVVEERLSGEAAMELVGEESSSKHSRGRLAFWKRSKDENVPAEIVPEDIPATPKSDRGIDIVADDDGDDNEDDSRFARSGIGYYDAVRKDSEGSIDDEDEEESRDEEAAVATRRSTMTKKKSFLPKFVRKGFSPLDKEVESAEKKSRGSLLGMRMSTGQSSPQKLSNAAEDSAKDTTQETIVETPDRLLPKVNQSPAAPVSPEAQVEMSVPRSTEGKGADEMEPPALRRRPQAPPAFESRGLPQPAGPAQSRGLQLPAESPESRDVQQQNEAAALRGLPQRETIPQPRSMQPYNEAPQPGNLHPPPSDSNEGATETTSSKGIFRKVPSATQAAPALTQTFSDESLLNDDIEEPVALDPEEKKEEVNAAPSQDDSYMIEEAIAAQLLGTSPTRSAETASTAEYAPPGADEEKLADDMELKDLDMDVDTYFHSTDLMSNYGGGSVQDHLSVVSTRSYKTSNTLKTAGTGFTHGTNYTTSSRKRHPGAAKTRLAAAMQAEKKKGKSHGWQESIQAAAANANRQWDPKKGWIDFVDPDSMVDESEVRTEDKIHIPIQRVKRTGAEKEEKEEVDQETTTPAPPVPFPSEWKEERSIMLQSTQKPPSDSFVESRDIAPPQQKSSPPRPSPSRASVSRPSPSRKSSADTTTPPKPRGWKETMKAATANLAIPGKRWDPDRGWIGMDDSNDEDVGSLDRYGDSISVQVDSDTQDFGMVVAPQPGAEEHTDKASAAEGTSPPTMPSPPNEEHATSRSIPSLEHTDGDKSDQSGLLMFVDSENSVDSGDQSRGASIKSGRSGRYMQIGDTGSVKSHYRNPAAKKAQETKDGPQVQLKMSVKNLDRVAEEQADENDEGRTNESRKSSLLVDVVKEKVGQEDAGLFPEIRSKRSSGPVDLDDLYDEEHASFGEPIDFSWDEGSNMSSFVGGSPRNQSPPVAQQVTAVPRIRINTRDTTPRNGKSPKVPPSNKFSDSRSLDAMSNSSKTIPKLRGPKRDTSPIRGRKSRHGSSQTLQPKPEIVSVEKRQQAEERKSLETKLDQQSTPITMESIQDDAAVEISKESGRSPVRHFSPDDGDAPIQGGHFSKDTLRMAENQVRQVSPESNTSPGNQADDDSESYGPLGGRFSLADEDDDEDDDILRPEFSDNRQSRRMIEQDNTPPPGAGLRGIQGPQHPERSIKNCSIPEIVARQNHAENEYKTFQGHPETEHPVNYDSRHGQNQQTVRSMEVYDQVQRGPPRPERFPRGRHAPKESEQKGFPPSNRNQRPGPSGPDDLGSSPVTPDRSLSTKSTQSKSPGDADDISFVSTDSRRSSVKLRAQFWESKAKSPEESDRKDSAAGVPGETAEWKSFLAKKVQAESAAANDQQQRLRKGREEDRDSLFDFPESEGAFPTAGRAVNRLPPLAENDPNSRQIGGEPNEEAFEEISDLSPIRVQHEDEDEDDRISETSSAVVQPSSSSTFLQRLQACAAPIIPRNNSNDDANCGAVPMAHLAFLRTNPSLNGTPEKQRSSRFAPPNFCGRPDVIVEGDEDDEESVTDEKAPKRGEASDQKEKPRSRSNPRPSRQSDVGSVISDEAFGAKTAYLEAIAMKTAVSGSKKNKRRSTGSDTSGSSRHSEKWQRFLDKKGSAGSKSENGSNNEVSKAAEKYAAEKVEEMMEIMAQRTNPKPFQSRPMEEATGAFPSVQKSRSSYPPSQADERKNESSRAAEDLAAARVEAMMQALSGQNMEEGEI